MIAKTNSASVLGIDAHPVDVEVDVSIGLKPLGLREDWGRIHEDWGRTRQDWGSRLTSGV